MVESGFRLGEEIIQGPYGVDAECLLLVEMATLPRPARGTGWPAVWKMAPTDIERKG